MAPLADSPPEPGADAAAAGQEPAAEGVNEVDAPGEAPEPAEAATPVEAEVPEPSGGDVPSSTDVSESGEPSVEAAASVGDSDAASDVVAEPASDAVSDSGATAAPAAASSAKSAARPRRDAVLSSAASVEAARAAAVDAGRDSWESASVDADARVGEHLGSTAEAERLLTHYFACTDKAYLGWRWAVTVSRVPRARTATICEAALVPGDDAVLSPAWVPYVDRLAPGDLGPGDATPYDAADQRLEPGFEATGEEDVDQMAQWELGLGRPRVLSAEGRDEAAQRWYAGDHGPEAAVAKQADAACTTCGFFLPMPGELRRTFGVCTNAWSPSDGKVVSLDHGCGAHSETDERKPEPERIDPPVIDEFTLDPFDLTRQPATR